MTARVPVIALTGHLGAGKTSLLNHLLRAPGARLGVVVNDFGELNVDAALVSGQVIDAVTHFQTVDTRETPPNRFATATLVVIGKADLLQEQEREAAVERICERVRARVHGSPGRGGFRVDVVGPMIRAARLPHPPQLGELVVVGLELDAPPRSQEARPSPTCRW